MAVDGRIPLAVQTPNLPGTLMNALIAGNELKTMAEQRPLRNRLLEGRNAAQEQVTASAAGREERASADAARQREEDVATYTLAAMKQWRDLPAEQRQASAGAFQGFMVRSGLMSEGDDFSDDPLEDDAWLDAQIGALEPVVAQAQSGRGGVDAQNFNARMKAAGIEPGTDDYIKAARVAAGLDPRAVGAADKVVMIGDVPHIFDPDSQKMIRVEVDGKEVTPESVGESSGTVAREVEKSKVIGKAEGEAVVSLPDVISNGEYMISTLEKAMNHPGLEVATGLSSKTDPRNFTPGTDAFDFNVIRDQIQGQTFLQAYQSLKGGGQITEVEGKKAEQAIARMNTAQSKESWVEAANEFIGVIQGGLSRAKAKSGQQDAQRRQSVEALTGDSSAYDFMTPEERALFDEPND